MNHSKGQTRTKLNKTKKGSDNMTKEQHKSIVDALVKFVLRALNTEKASEKELELLPDALLLLGKFTGYIH